MTSAPVNRARLAAWGGLVGLIAVLNYAARFSSSGGSATSSENDVYRYSTFTGGLVLYAVWLGVVLLITRDRFDLLCWRRPSRWPRALQLAGGVVAAIWIWELIVSALPLPQSPGKEQALAPTHWEAAHAGAFAANCALFVVIAPLVEELTFRGAGQSLLAFLGRTPSILAVGVAFGLAHGLVEAELVLIPFGVLLAVLRDRTSSVFPGMLVHALFNGIALALAVLT